MEGVTVDAATHVLKYRSKTNITTTADDETYTVTIATTNYEDITATLTFRPSDKETVTISGLTYADKTYDGQPIAPAGTLTVSGDKVPVSGLEVNYEGTGSTVYDSVVAPKNAGTYKVTYKVADSNESYIGEAVYPFTISPKAVTVAPKNVSITKGAAIPAFELAYDGLVAGEMLTPSTAPAFTCFESDGTTAVNTSTAAGTYTITWTNAESTTFADGNYNVAKATIGALTIAGRSTSSSGGGGGGGGSSTPTYPVAAPSKVENGAVTVSPRNASRGSTVTITVQPEDGFQLTGLTVTDKDGNERKLTDKGGGKYTFTMPGSKVEIKAVFAPEVETSPFADVAADAYYYEAVKWAKEQGITGGTGKGLFGSDQPCTRAQIVTFLWRAAGAPEPKAAGPFRDVVSGSYYEKAVAWAIENGITAGASATAFRPDAPCTRAQAVTFLARAAKAAASGSVGFRDVPDHAYYAEAVKWAADNGITSGIGKDRFGPDAHCTRAQIVTFLWRLYAGK
nr:S-layer homology domain-containing protein [Pseudoflavonifractor sp. MSJ-37]